MKRLKKAPIIIIGIQGESTSAQIDQFLSDLAKQTGRVKLAAKNWWEV